MQGHAIDLKGVMNAKTGSTLAYVAVLSGAVQVDPNVHLALRETGIQSLPHWLTWQVHRLIRQPQV